MKPINFSKPKPLSLTFIFATLFLDVMGSTLLMPILAYIVRQYNSDALTIGLLSVVYSAAAFLAAPALGRMSDKWGRRPVLLISVLGSAIGYLIFGLAGAVWVLFLSRLIDGLTGGNIATAMAYIADVTEPKNRAKYFGFGGIAFGLGFIMGPMIAGALSTISLSAPAFAAGALSLASFTFGYFFLPESLPEEKREKEPMRLSQANPFSVMIELGSLPDLRLLFAAFFILNSAYSGLFSYITIYTIFRFNALPVDNSILFVVVGIFQMVGQGAIVYRLTPRFGEKKIALVGLLLQVLAYPLFILAPNFIYLYPLAVLSALGNAFTRPTLDTMVANSVAPHEQGRAAGTSAGLASLANILGPLAAGLLYDFLSPHSVFITSSVLIAITFLIISKVRSYSTEPAPVRY